MCVWGGGVTNNRVAMVQPNLEKASDRVRDDVLFAVLSHVGFGNVVFESVKMSYTGCTTRLVINRELCENIHVLSSERQGCPPVASFVCGVFQAVVL